jgi:hypothetical protein
MESGGKYTRLKAPKKLAAKSEDYFIKKCSICKIYVQFSAGFEKKLKLQGHMDIF